MAQTKILPSDDVLYTDEFASAVIEGLGATQKNIPCQYLYDAAGSDLFEDLTYLEEYYPTRTEIALLEKHAGDIAEMTDDGALLVEFGSGSSRKTNILLEEMKNIAAYIPIDISDAALEDAEGRLNTQFPKLKVIPIHTDFNQDVDLPEDYSSAYRLGFFPGSTLGNFERDKARQFLEHSRGILGPKSGFIIGVDLQKDPSVLVPAYDDAKGVTAKFNLNVLNRINSDLDGTFDLDKFRHRAIYNEQEARVEMHIESLEDQEVKVLGQSVNFAQGETIHTENSHKYTVASFEKLAAAAGWSVVQTWIDDGQLFSVHYLRPSQSV
ncbi:MAG: L-histidine N(alpha)-methyltransferase [Pseudomonadota bacterium]